MAEDWLGKLVETSDVASPLVGVVSVAVACAVVWVGTCCYN